MILDKTSNYLLSRMLYLNNIYGHLYYHNLMDSMNLNIHHLQYNSHYISCILYYPHCTILLVVYDYSLNFLEVNVEQYHYNELFCTK